MRIKITKSKNYEFYYIIKDVNKKGKRTTVIVEKLGKLDDIKLSAENQDPIQWLNQHLKELNIKEKEGKKY